jgi:excisionase family DNA binding protein
MAKVTKTRNASWVANHLGTSPQTVARLIEEGKLQAYKLRERGPWHILLESVDAFLAQCKERHGITPEQKP